MLNALYGESCLASVQPLCSSCLLIEGQALHTNGYVLFAKYSYINLTYEKYKQICENWKTNESNIKKQVKAGVM